MAKNEKITKKQREILAAIAEHEPEGWGELWSFLDAGPQPGHSAFRMMNFDRAVNALRHKELIDDNGDTIELTEAGHKVLGEAVDEDNNNKTLNRSLNDKK